MGSVGGVCELPKQAAFPNGAIIHLQTCCHADIYWTAHAVCQGVLRDRRDRRLRGRGRHRSRAPPGGEPVLHRHGGRDLPPGPPVGRHLRARQAGGLPVRPVALRPLPRAGPPRRARPGAPRPVRGRPGAGRRGPHGADQAGHARVGQGGADEPPEPLPVAGPVLLGGRGQRRGAEHPAPVRALRGGHQHGPRPLGPLRALPRLHRPPGSGGRLRREVRRGPGREGDGPVRVLGRVGERRVAAVDLPREPALPDQALRAPHEDRDGRDAGHVPAPGAREVRRPAVHRRPVQLRGPGRRPGPPSRERQFFLRLPGGSQPRARSRGPADGVPRRAPTAAAPADCTGPDRGHLRSCR
mmetsp:Transcript_99149/g.280828  ORF Transcript_99149/g.280828 Transcript_99149/m.280828 type:complete len:354 (+) Transcript_99149:1841-2902(+)